MKSKGPRIEQFWNTMAAQRHRDRPTGFLDVSAVASNGDQNLTV
jgi:hypothetical protein